MSSADQAHFSPAWLEQLAQSAESDPWILGFEVQLEDGETAIGYAGFKGPPDSKGVVEIAYAIDPEHQNRGFATEASAVLVRYALGQADVRAIRAHTLPETNASTRVLTKMGFSNAGEVIDPDDGPVWRWEIVPRSR
ncbi:MAG: GNAT family N-acetyltransferase [Opitutaceae bacterium]|nr:GNAT family N-acetyltransferase [Opitutaceae bacterium]